MSADEKGYNGWTNYETWNVALWLDNDDFGYQERDRMAKAARDEAKADSTFTREERARIILAENLKELIEETNPLSEQASMFSDLLGAALSEVNWQEIARHYLEEVDKAEEAEEVEAE